MSVLTIYGDRISGNCLKVKWTAEHLGLDYQWVDVDVRKRETRTPAFLKINPAGQAPVVVFEDGETLSQSNAIIWTLATRQDAPLFPNEPEHQAKVMEWLFWEQYSHEPSIAVRRFKVGVLGQPDDEIDPILIEKGNACLSLMDQHLQADWFVDDALSLADVALVAYTRVADEGGFDLAAFPNVQAWVGRVERALSINPQEGRL